MPRNKPALEKASLSQEQATRTTELHDLIELTAQLARQQNGIDSLFAEQIGDLRQQLDYQTSLTIQLDHESMTRLQTLAELSMQVAQMNRTLEKLVQRLNNLEQTSPGYKGDE